MRSRAHSGRRGVHLALLAALAVACGAPPPPPEPAMLTIALPAGSPPAAMAGAQPVVEALAASSHLRIRLTVPSDPQALADAIRRGTLDAALVSQPAYAELQAAAPVRVVAQGRLAAPTPVLICGSSSGVPALADGASWEPLRGRTVLFGPRDSLSRNAWPRYFLTRNGITPVGDLGTARVVPDERQALLDVYNGIADCAAASSDARSSIAYIAPDATQRLVVVFTAPDPVPPPPVVVRSKLGADLQRRLTAALLAVKPDTPASAALGALAGYGSFQPASDRDYAGLRAVLQPR